MSRRVFMTGGTGFLGRSLVDRLLSDDDVEDVNCLIRNDADVPSFAASSRLRLTVGDVTQPESYAEQLATCDTVLHLAAATGNASKQEHWRINAEGTSSLVSASQHAGVKHFVFVSSIAVGYPDQTHYHYAQSKAAAEQIVLSSSVHSTVVRPTIVTGPNAPVTRGLRKLRRGRMLILFGRADVNVQPIARRDVVELLLEVITNPPTERLIEAGGSESLPLRRFLELLCSPDGKPLVPVTIPVHPVRTLLAMLEPSLGLLLPLTAGQLALFLNDSTAAPSSVSTARRSMQLNELVAECHS